LLCPRLCSALPGLKVLVTAVQFPANSSLPQCRTLVDHHQTEATETVRARSPPGFTGSKAIQVAPRSRHKGKESAVDRPDSFHSSSLTTEKIHKNATPLRGLSAAQVPPGGGGRSWHSLAVLRGGGDGHGIGQETLVLPQMLRHTAQPCVFVECHQSMQRIMYPLKGQNVAEDDSFLLCADSCLRLDYAVVRQRDTESIRAFVSICLS